MNLREKIEKEITDKVMTKLASEKVELGLVDDLNKKWASTTSGYGEVNNLVRKANSKLNDMLKEYTNLESEAKTIDKKLKDLGITSSEFIEVARKIARDKKAILDTKKRNIGSF